MGETLTLSEMSKKINKLSSKRESLIDQRESAKSEVIVYRSKLENLEKAQAFIQKVAQETQEQLSFHIQDIVQLALDACFPEYDFSVEFEIKRGQTEAKLLFMKDNHEVDPMEESGGGAAELSAFALRIASWTLGKTDNVIVLDEPFKAVSADIRPRAIAIMKELSEKLGIQFIMVTHDPSIVEIADKVFEVKIVKKISRVKEVAG